MHKVLYPRNDDYRLYVSRKEGGRGIASIEFNLDEWIRRLKDYIEKLEGRLITAVRKDADNMMFKRIAITRKQNGKENSSVCVLND